VITRPSRSPSGVSAVRVDDTGIQARSRSEVILDVLFDQRRIWSFWLHRDGLPERGGHRVAWPGALREFLNGTTRLTLTVHGTEDVVFDEEVTLGNRQGRIAVVNPDGKPLALDKSLRRVQTFDTRSADNVEPLIRAIDDVLSTLKEVGVDAFLAYGTLLGAVRNGRLIGHDSDADLGYLSTYEHPVDVIRESFQLQRALVQHGYRVTRYSGGAFKVDVRESDGAVRGLDVFGGFMYDGRLHLMGEIRTKFRREWVLPLGTTTLEGRQFPAPADTDRFLAATYGASWRVPDPAFHFATPTSTHRRLNGWFRGIRMQRALWDRAYANPRTPVLEPSDLAGWIAEREGDVPDFVDIGCGAGVDTWWMASRGGHATGLDFVHRSFVRMQNRARADGVDAEFLTFNLLELRSLLSVSALVASRPGPRIVMGRHLVDAIGSKARENLWRASAMMLRDGGRLYLQFLASSGDDDYARTNRVRPRRPEAVARELRAAGARIVHREVIPVTNDGPSTSEAGDDVPSKICRMVAQWER
jgi:SAM-dependent methyltransferase